jgi:peroxiredoxin
MAADYSQLPADLPRPVDDGAADHLPGAAVPAIALPATTGGKIDLAELAEGLLVAYVYPRTGTPGEPLPDGWNDIPGARGCTPQSCAYREALAEFRELDATLVGISAQSAAEQAEFAAREQIPFPLLSDDGLRLAAALRLPTFEVEGMRLYRRLTLVAEAGGGRQGLLPRLPSRSQRRGGARLAAGPQRQRPRSPGAKRPGRSAGTLMMEAPRFELGSADAVRGCLQV